MSLDSEYDARQAARAKELANAQALLKTPFATPDPKVGNTGKTQAQLDAAKGAADTATMINEQYGALGIKSVVDPKTGRVITDNSGMAKVAADKAAAAAKLIADAKTAAEVAAAKAAAEAAAAAKAAALQKQIDDLIAEGKLAEARRLEDKLRSDNELKAQAAASKLAYDTAAQDKKDAIKVERVSAYQTLKTEFEKYGLGSLVESVEALILNGTPKSEATLKLRATPQYQLRFAGNTQHLAAGKNLYDESTYLALENDFQTSFEAYGQKALLGNTRESAQAMFAEYIGSDKSPTEIKDRIRLAVDEVSNRKDIRAEFQKFFPEITDSDLVSYFLKPKETLSTLNAKVRVAQIGSAASAQGLNASLTTATDLEQLGLTEQQARTGYQRVATDLPTIGKLGDIDKTNIGQTTAENAYLKGLASEQRKIDQAAERERSRFAQSSGMNKVSLTDTKSAGQY